MQRLLEQIHELGGWFPTLAVLIGYILSFVLLYYVIFRVLRHRFIRTYVKAPPLLYPYLYYPLLYLTILLSLSLGFRVLESDIGSDIMAYVRHGYQIMLIISVTQVIRRSVVVLRELVFSYFDTSLSNNLKSRKVLTQFKMIERITSFVLIILAISFILLSFDSIREVGMGLLTSAGVLGIVIGFAAQKSIANVVAGIQLAFAQPIRLDDVVIVENEWGKIEEITLTYVVIKIWDERRLVVPLNYFIEKPFQNWTRQSSDLIGSVFIYSDYNVPLDALRTELDRLLEADPLWDKRVKVLQVTDSQERTLQLRALMSAKDAPDAFDLRCNIREGLIVFLQKNYPQSLPRTRIEVPNTFPDHLIKKSPEGKDKTGSE